MRPVPSCFNSVNCMPTKAVLFSYCGSLFSRIKSVLNRNNICVFKNSSWGRLTGLNVRLKKAGIERMSHIFGSCAPLKVLYAIILFVPINVVNKAFSSAFRYKGISNKPVNKNTDALVAISKVRNHVSMMRHLGFHRSSTDRSSGPKSRFNNPSFGPENPFVGYLINVAKYMSVFPDFHKSSNCEFVYFKSVREMVQRNLYLVRR